MKYTEKEWKDEGTRRFGANFGDWKFVCPACGRVNIGHEFKEAGAKPNDMYSTCIGRHNGKGIDGMKHKKEKGVPKHGCNWAAFGLFGTMGKGDTVVSASGKETDVFAFAEMEAAQ